MIKNEFKKLKKLELGSEEKKALFERLSEKIGGNRLQYPVPSPFLSFSFIATHRYVQAGLLSFIFIIASGATAAASLRTLPGDMLYGVKTNVVEKIPKILYRSPEQKAEYNVEIINQRMEEFEELAEKGELSPDSTEKIGQELKKNFGEFNDNLDKIKKNDLESNPEPNQESNVEILPEEKEDSAEAQTLIQEPLSDIAEEKKESAEKVAEPTLDERLEDKLEQQLEKHAEKIRQARDEAPEENKKPLELLLEQAESYRLED